MTAVPGGIDLRVPKAEIGAQVDYLQTRLPEEPGDDAHGNGMGQGQKDLFTPFGNLIRRGVHEGEVRQIRKGGVDGRDGAAGVTTRGHRRDLHLWMAQEQAQQFLPGITAGPVNADLDHLAPPKKKGGLRPPE